MMNPTRIAQSGGVLTVLGLGVVAGRLFDVLPAALGTLGMLVCLGGMTTLMTFVLYRVCFIQIDKLSSWVLGAVGALGTVGICMALPIIFAQLTVVTALAMLALAGVILVTCAFVSTRQHQAPQVVERGRLFGWPAQNIIASHYLWIVAYVGVWILGAVSLIGIGATTAIVTPWVVLPSLYLIAVAIGGFLLLLFLFSHFKTSVILGVIVLQSLLMHAYIPASHILPAGGDIWRHIGIVEHIFQGNPVNPVLFGSTATFDTIGGIVMPSVLLQPQQYAYSVQWGAMTLWQMVTGVDLIGMSIWSIPILFAIVVPILLFYIGVLLFRSSRHGLILSALSLVPFALLSLGSLTLPVTIGFLYFFFGIFLLCSALRYGTRMQWMFVSLTALGMFFVYPLYSILYAWCVLVAGVLFTLHGDAHQTVRRIWLSVSTVFGIVLLPVVELFAGYSGVPETISLVETTKRIIGELSGWYIASAIRPHDILSGNILYNHIPEASFVSLLFATVRWPLMLLMIGLIFLALYGWGYAWYKEKRMNWQLLAVLTATVWGGYLISWYVLVGERQLVRRLDMVCAVLLLWFAWYGYTRAIDALTHSHDAKRRVTFVLFLSAVLVWWGSMSAFTLGPDMRVMSVDEYAVGQYIANSIDGANTCVLADTWVLLAVEAASAQRVIGGNFAMDAQYGQPERVALYEMALSDPTSTLWQSITAVYDGAACILVLPLEAKSASSYGEAYGTPRVVGSFGVWQLELQKSDISSTIDE